MRSHLQTLDEGNKAFFPHSVVTATRLTHARSAGGEFEAGRALATVAAGNVDAVSVALAQVVPAVALVDI